jgi:putative FmdB family regulatory protein
MPIFEYECGKCGHQFEFLVIPTSPTAKCPSCGSKKLDQMISMFAVSSESTRQISLKSAQKRNKKIGKEMAHEEHQAMHREHHH